MTYAEISAASKGESTALYPVRPFASLAARPRRALPLAEPASFSDIRTFPRRSLSFPDLAWKRRPSFERRSGSVGPWRSTRRSCARQRRAMVCPPPLFSLASALTRANDYWERETDIERYTDKYKTADQKPPTLSAADYAPKELQPTALYEAYYSGGASAAGKKKGASRLTHCQVLQRFELTRGASCWV